MIKWFKRSIILILMLLLFINQCYGATSSFLLNADDVTIVNKNNILMSNFNSDYNISNSTEDENYNLNQEITELTQKVTFLLLGDMNEQNESSEEYYKRHKDYLSLRYNPEIPKDENNRLGLDTESQEYSDDILSGISVPGMFLLIHNLDIKYSSYGTIKISKINDEEVLSIITIPDVLMKESEDGENIIKTNLSIYYFFKKTNNEYKILYLFAENSDDIEEYTENNNEKKGEFVQNENYNSQLKDIYSFSKADLVDENIINGIYNSNKSNIVYLNSLNNLGSVEVANGFFINEGIIITTYNYIEKSLLKAQNIIISDSLGNVYELDGIVTMNESLDTAILKVKNKTSSYIDVKETEELKTEDAVISINSKDGVGLKSSKGIIIISDDIQTSIPITSELQGSPLFNNEGNLIGMINSKLLNTSISDVTSLDIIKEYYNIFSNIDFNDITCISFDDLKENYYIQIKDEKVEDNIPQKIIKKNPEIEKVDEFIKLKKIKSYYKDGIITLRYKNEINDYINTIQICSDYFEYLKKNGFTENVVSDSKIIFENKNYKIIVMAEFDYLIIVMVRV